MTPSRSVSVDQGGSRLCHEFISISNSDAHTKWHRLPACDDVFDHRLEAYATGVVRFGFCNLLDGREVIVDGNFNRLASQLHRLIMEIAELFDLAKQVINVTETHWPILFPVVVFDQVVHPTWITFDLVERQLTLP